MRLASSDLERCRGWITRAADGMWGAFLQASECHIEGDEEGERKARAIATQCDLALTLAVLRYCQTLGQM